MQELVHKYMIEPNPFIQFGADHIIGSVIFLILWIWLPLYSKENLSKNSQNRLGIILGFIVMSNYLVWVILEIISGTFDFKLHLPFHLCRFANLAIPIVMIWKKERLFQVLYFWGMSGMLQGAITPDVTHGFPHFHYFRFFIGHNGMVLVLIYAIVVLGFRPSLKGLFDSFIALNLFLILAAVINLVLDSNYFWICAKPPTNSLLDYLGPWPWYILIAEFVALLHYFLAFLPFYILNNKKR
tara:strand:- start:104 stop:826 length:723 start_codon:yes stop_codon:yes gene_type:complete